MAPSLFPLPLTPFESYYWCDDRPDYPTVFPIELTLSGQIDRSRLERAVALALARHPMLTARIAGGRWPLWIAGDARPPAIDWAESGVPVGHREGERIDLTRRPGIRFWVRQGESTARLLVQFHHACCDGAGALGFLEDLLVCYACLTRGESGVAGLRPLDPERLRTRGDYGRALSRRVPALRDLWVGGLGWAKLLVRAPAPVAVPASTAPGPEPPPSLLAFQTRTLNPQTVRNLRRAAAARGGTLNDLLLRDLFLTLRRWNRRHAGRQRRQRPWLRISVPTSLRSKADYRMPAANVLSFAFLTRRACDCDDPDRLLESIRSETEAIKRWRLGLYFLGGLAVARGIPGALPWFLGWNRSFATAVMSHLGRVFTRTPLPRREGRLVCGNLVLQRVAGVPPIRPWTRAAVAVVAYGGSTTVSLRADPHLFRPDRARTLLDHYVATLEESGRSAHPATS